MKHITFQTFWISSSFVYANGRPERSMSSTELWPSLKRLYHSWVCVLLMASFQNACFNILKDSENDFPNFHTKHTAHEIRQFLIMEKFPKQAR
jgi:hypothetical protein